MISKLNQIFLIVLSLSACLQFANASNYYLSSSSGNDNNDGMSPARPFKSLEKINSLTLSATDTVFLKKGDVFFGTLIIQNSGQQDMDIVITAYGKGPLPVIKGAKTLTNYKTVGELSVAREKDSIYAAYLGHNVLLPARYPADGMLHFDGGGRNYMIDSELSAKNIDIQDATIRMRIKNWSYENKIITKVHGDTAFFDKNLWRNNHEKYECEKSWGYFLDNKKEFIVNEHDWAYNTDEKAFYIKTHAEDKIEVTTLKSGAIIKPGVNYVTIKEVAFEKFYSNGILLAKDASNINIQNCTLRNIVLVGIESKENTRNITIANCTLKDIFGQGISVVEGNHVLIEHNNLKKIGLHSGYGIDGNNGGMGIIITNNEIRTEGYTSIAHNNTIRFNKVDSVGNYAIRMDGIQSICEYNIVSNGLLTFNDGALIYCWGMDSSFTNHNVIQHNLVTKSHGNLTGSPKSQLINVGIYIDNNVNNVIVRNNTITETQIGILFNSLSHSNKALNNVLYNNTSGICFSEYHQGYPIYGMEVKNNIIIGIGYDQRTIYSKSYVHNTLAPGIIDSNFHYNPKVDFLINSITTFETFRRDEEMSLYEWQKRGFDKNGYTFSFDNLENNQKAYPEHLINYEDSVREIIFENGNYYNTSGQPIKSIKIPPLSSAIVLRKPNN